MTDVADLQIKVDSKGVITATSGLKKLDVQSGKTEDKNKKLTRSFGLVKAAVGAFAASLVIKQFISTAAAFETMKVSLEVVTGSAEKATMAFGGILELAKETPFSVSELTEAFIKLKSLGLDPSEASLISYGNTASAMGKSLNQMIEAIADASVGEFERLKEFGIKARSQGDQVSFTFQGVTKTVKKNAEEITGYLQGLGDVQFAGGMAMQMDTVNGAFSNAGDAVDLLANKLGESGLNTVVKEVTLSFAALVTGLANFFDSGDTTSKLEVQIMGVTGEIFALQSAVEDAQEGGWFQEMFGGAERQIDIYVKQIDRLSTKLDDLNARLIVAQDQQGGGIDEAGKGGKFEATEAEITAEADKNARLMEMDIAFRANVDEIRAQSLQTRLDEEANLVLFAQAKSLQDKQIYDDQLIQQENQKNQAMRNIAQGALGDASALMGAGSKKAFAIGKSFALGQATVKGFSSAVSAWDAGMSTGGPWAPAVAAAYTAASLIKTGVQIKQIKGTQISGQAHDGMDYIPKTGSYILEQGEAVIKKQEAGKIRADDVGGGNITFAPVIQAFDPDEIGRNKDKLFEGMRNSFIDWMNEEGVRFA